MKLPAWLEAVSPGHLSVFLLRDAAPRKSGLFIRHLCRCFPEIFNDPLCLAALDAADAHEAGEIGEDEFGAALGAVSVALSGGQAAHPWETSVARRIAAEGFYHDVLTDLRRAVLYRAGGGQGPRKNPTARAMRPLFFEHFGDTQSPVALDPSWLTSTVAQLAGGIYADRAFDRLPILADALQDAGCEHPDVLNHCRSDGPHVRGCWVVDLVLGKS